MNMIEKVLNQYKLINEKIIYNIKNHLDTDNLFKEKEELIFELIHSGKYKIEEVKSDLLKLDLDASDGKVKKCIQDSMISVKKDLYNLKNRKNASNSYNKNINPNRFFSTKV